MGHGLPGTAGVGPALLHRAPVAEGGPRFGGSRGSEAILSRRVRRGAALSPALAGGGLSPPAGHAAGQTCGCWGGLSRAGLADLFPLALAGARPVRGWGLVLAAVGLGAAGRVRRPHPGPVGGGGGGPARRGQRLLAEIRR